MALQSPIAAPAAPHSQRQTQTFEFTKRKKWTDILVSELPDTVLLILDTDKQIQYVGPNTTDVLGWQVEELVDTDVLDIVNDDDKRHFNGHLQNSLSSRQDLSCHARLKCKPDDEEKPDSQKELLFEIRGHALYIPNDNECKCFLVVAKPYPSRNMAVLNTFLELKIENERLTQRLKELRAQQDLLPAPSDEHGGSAHPSTTMTHFSGFEFAGPQNSASQSPTSGNAAGSIGSMHSGFVHSILSSGNPRDDDSEDGGKKKKLKKTNVPAQQYVCVTCGRTDSPEWRKGPKGPKTLCNACGLRWAKRAKQTDDVPIPYVQGGQGSREGQEGARPSASSSSSGRGGRGAPVPNAALSVTPTEPPPPSASSKQQQQGRYDTNVSAASPTHTVLGQTPTPIAPAPPNPAHYGMHIGIPISTHPQSTAAIQPSPTSAVAQHPYSQAQTQEQYHQAVYDQHQHQHHHYSWPPMNHHHRGGGYGY